MAAADSVEIVDVWAENLEESFEQIRAIVEDYPYIAMARLPPFLPLLNILNPLYIILCAVYWHARGASGFVLSSVLAPFALDLPFISRGRAPSNIRFHHGNYATLFIKTFSVTFWSCRVLLRGEGP